MHRVHAVDWLRGLALLVMIQTHSLVLLSPDTHADPLFRWLVRIDGLVAPAFILCAGFALALMQCRAALKGERRPQAIKSLKRIGEVLLAATFVNAVWFPLISQPKWLFRIDILQCIGLSLLLVLPLLVWLSSRPIVLRWVMLALSLTVFAIAPFFEKVDGFLGLFLNPQPGFLEASTGSVFPLLPWAGYVFMGASIGASVAAMTREADLWEWLGLLAFIGVTLWVQQSELNLAYPPHTFWVTNPANAAQRWALVVGLIALFRIIEIRRPSAAQSTALKWLAAFSASSLSAYVFHEMLLYQRTFGIFTRLWREQANWPQYAVLLLALIIATWLCVRLTSWVTRRRAAS